MIKISERISKRKRFVLTSFVLTIIIGLISEFAPMSAGVTPYIIYIGLGILTYILSFWSLKEDIKGTELITLFVIPVVYTIGTLAFTFILPDRKLYRYPLIAIYPIAMYAILLTNNIFNVAAIRTIQLLRAARAVAYLMTLVTTYLSVTVVAASRPDTFIKILLIVGIVYFVTYQFFWSFDLGRGEGRKVHLYSVTTTTLLTQIVLLMQLTPVNAALEGLVIITSLYCILGISTHYLERKLTKRIATEYIMIAAIISTMVFYTLPWRG